jgi:hypothetical protein
MMDDLSESPRRIGWSFKGGTAPPFRIAPTRIQHEGVQVNASKNTFALDSFRSENFTTPHSPGEFLSAEFPFEVGMNSRPEPPTRIKFIKNVWKHFAI